MPWVSYPQKSGTNAGNPGVTSPPETEVPSARLRFPFPIAGAAGALSLGARALNWRRIKRPTSRPTKDGSACGAAGGSQEL